MQVGSEYWDLFFDEVDSQLQLLSIELNKLEKDSANQETIKEIFRIVHTVKGMAATVGFNSVTKLCHSMEELFDYFRSNHCGLSPELVKLQIKSADGLFKVVEIISDNGQEITICDKLSDALCKELKHELSLLKNNSSTPQNNSLKTTNTTNLDDTKSLLIGQDKEIKLQIKFAQDCQMPGVRAYMATQALESHSQIIHALPSQEQLLEDGTIPEQGLEVHIKSSKPNSFF